MEKMEPKRTDKSVTKLPHFELSDVQQIEPERLLNSENDEVGAFFLSLSLAYNDLKGVLWTSQVMIDAQGGPDAPFQKTARRGQTGGMSVQAMRYSAGIAHEILKLVREHRVLVDGSDFESLDLTPAGLTRWQELKDLAYARESDNGLVRALAAIRNSIAFHYYSPKNVAKSFSEHFRQPDEGNALLSVGKNTEQTRFYYADAAAQYALRRCAIAGGVDPDTFQLQLRSVLWTILEATMAALSGFVASRGGIFPRDVLPVPTVQRGPSHETRARKRAARKRKK